MWSMRFDRMTTALPFTLAALAMPLLASCRHVAEKESPMAGGTATYS